MQWAAWLAALALAACGGSPTPVKVTADWLTNPDEAFQTAVQKGRPVFIAFVGSDWSDASQGITKDVFDTQTFKDFADNYLVLLRVDLARHPEIRQSCPDQRDAGRRRGSGRIADHDLVRPDE